MCFVAKEGYTVKKVFIVDDEKQAVENIYHSFDWVKLQVDDIVKIYDCDNLISRILTDEPNIVFIDVEMGNQSGLDIVRDCKKQKSTANFVIVSGHDDFNFAQTAANLNVLHYILKPLDSQDIEIVTNKILNLPEFLRIATDMGEMLLDSKSFNDFISKYETVKLSNEKICLICHMLSSDFHDFNAYIEAYVLMSNKIGKNKYFYILNANLSVKKLEIILHNFTLMRKVCFGVSESFTAIDDAYSRFKQANKLSYGYFINNKKKVFFRETSDIGSFKYYVDKIINLIDSGLKNEINQFMIKLSSLFIESNLNISHVLLFYNSLIIHINDLAYKKMNANLFPELLSIDELIANYSSFEKLIDEFLFVINELLNTNDISEKLDKAVFLQKINDYIEDNYKNKISIPEMCKQLFVGTTYFYSYFKQYKGITFTEYLTNYRIEKAKQLLIHTQKSISTIAEEVGFLDNGYFAKVFKVHCGTTPSKYRKGFSNETNKE